MTMTDQSIPEVIAIAYSMRGIGSGIDAAIKIVIGLIILALLLIILGAVLSIPH